MNDYLQTRRYRGHTITVQFKRDELGLGAPWEEHDGHGIVSDWVRRDADDGELLLSSDRSFRRFYDFRATMKLAKRDGWGLTREAKRALAARLGRHINGHDVLREAVMSDYRYLRDWCEDRWEWVWRQVTIDGFNYYETCGGFESCSIDDYAAPEAFEEAQAWLDRELTESHDAACRGVETEAA